MSLLDTLRAPRIGPFSAFDTVGTLLLSVPVSKFFKVKLHYTIIVMFIGGEIAHELVGQETPGTMLIKKKLLS